jgi:hypothetical protein
MSEMLRAGIVRIFREWDQQVVSVGFLVNAEKKTILTCAHVINAALGKPNNQDKPRSLIGLDFPFLAAGQRYDARVLHFFPKTASGTSDIAVLEVLDDLPIQAKAVRLVVSDSYSGNDFSVYGFPQGFEESGQYVEGKLQEQLANKRIQAVGTTNLGYFVEGGFSGSPIFDKQLNAVVGMIMQVDIEADKRVAFISPTEVLAKAYSELHYQRSAHNAPETLTRNAIFDRIKRQKQLSKITSFDMGIGLSVGDLNGERSVNKLKEAARLLYHLLTYSFLDACETSSIHDFVFLYSLFIPEQSSNAQSVQVSLICHISAFVASFQELLTTYFDKPDEEFLTRTSIYPEDLKIKISYRLGTNIPYRIVRTGLKSVQIECLDKPFYIVKSPLKTSDLLIYLSAAINGKGILHDDVDFASLPRHEIDLFNYLEQAKKRGINFLDFDIDVSNPESWTISTKGIQL